MAIEEKRLGKDLGQARVVPRNTGTDMQWEAWLFNLWPSLLGASEETDGHRSNGTIENNETEHVL